jgi:multiple sugar transport system ATP-binding protein
VGTHRRADLQVRIESRSGWKNGMTVHLAIDLARVLFFGPDGRRVDPVHR